MEIKAIIENLLLVAGEEGITVLELEGLFDEDYDFSSLLNELIDQYKEKSFKIEVINGKYKYITSGECSEIIGHYASNLTGSKLTPAAMEVLAMIAYNQPLTKLSIDEVRGVDSGYLIRRLQNHRLIEVSGRSEIPGRPNLYVTTYEFLNIIGIDNLSELPEIEANFENKEEMLFKNE